MSEWTRDDEKRARRAADVVAGTIGDSDLHCDTCSAQACDGIVAASFDQLRLRDAVYEVIREAVVRERNATLERVARTVASASEYAFYALSLEFGGTWPKVRYDAQRGLVVE